MFQDGPIGHLPPASSGRRFGRTRSGAAFSPRSGRRHVGEASPRSTPDLCLSLPTHADRGRLRLIGEGNPPPNPQPPTHGSQSLPSQQFQALFDSLFKVLFIFPSRYLFAIGLPSVFSLRWDLPPALGCIPKQPDSAKAARGVPGHPSPRGSHPLGRPFPGNLGRGGHRARISRLQFASRGLEIFTLGSSRFARRY